MQKSSTFQPQRSIPDTLSYIHSLILGSQSLSQAKQAHAQATLQGLLHRHLPICAALILTYSDFQDTSTSCRLFEQTPLKHQGAFLWNTLVRSYTKAGLHGEAFGVYNRMACASVRPDDRTFPFVLKACTDAADFWKGREVHGSVVKSGFGADVFVGNTLLAFYGVSSAMSDVHKAFDEIPERDIISWNSLLSVFSVNGYLSKSLDWFLELTRTGLMVNSVSVVSILPVCAALGDVVFGKEIHGLVIKVGLDFKVTVGNAFVDMYGKCSDLEVSRQVFWSMPEKNDVSWNAVVGSLVHAGLPIDALSMFRAMLADEMKLNSITVSILLPALVELRFFDMGKEVHGYSIRTGMDHDVFVANSLVDMYAKSGCVKAASVIFYRMDRRNVVTWNAMIANFAQNRAELESIRLIREMQVNGEYPNAVTFTNILPACARIASLKHGKEIHAKSIREGSCFDLFVSNALMDMYVKCGCLDLARSVFVISEKDVVSYNTLIVGYSQSRHCSAALYLFLEMGFVGLKYDVVSFMGVLSACANLPAIKQGKEIHGLSMRKLFHNHLFVANSLLDLYTKNGQMDIAKRIFDQISNKDVASWNAIILGYGMQGEFRVAVDLFDLMKDGDIECDSVSYIAVLSACSHGGLVERGKRYFNQMLSQNFTPTQMHYACMVDLLGRAGLMKEVKDFINDMALEPDSNVWGALLGACRVYGNLELGRWAAEHLFELKPGHCGYYILLSNMYAEAGRWDEANEIRKLMKSRGVKKNPGCSWVEVDRRMHAFVVGERLEEPRAESEYY